MAEGAVLTPPLGAGPKGMETWVKGQIKSEVPRGFIYRALINSPLPDDFDEMAALEKEERRLGDLLVRRNLQGQKAERAGDEDRAIKLYEANAKDRFDGSYPYERLLVIYARRGRLKEAIRVCEIYLHDIAQDQRLCEVFRKWIAGHCPREEST